jgi:hypothetical protein
MITSKEYKYTYYICIKHGTSSISRFNCKDCRKDKIIKMFSLEKLST